MDLLRLTQAYIRPSKKKAEPESEEPFLTPEPDSDDVKKGNGPNAGASLQDLWLESRKDAKGEIRSPGEPRPLTWNNLLLGIAIAPKALKPFLGILTQAPRGKVLLTILSRTTEGISQLFNLAVEQHFSDAAFSSCLERLGACTIG